MKALGIVGSYRMGGVVDAAVQEVLAGAADRGAETELVKLAELDMAYCLNCRACSEDQGPAPGQCVHKDGVEAVVRAAQGSDLLVLGSPVNFGHVTALTKTFWERLAVVGVWPEHRWIPQLRAGIGSRRAVVISSATAPPMVTRLAGDQSVRELTDMARLLGARRVDTLRLGLAGLDNDHSLARRHQRRAFRLGQLSVDGSHLRRKALLAAAMVDAGGLPTVVRGVLAGKA